MENNLTYTPTKQMSPVSLPAINVTSKAGEAFDSLISIVNSASKMVKTETELDTKASKQQASDYLLGMDSIKQQYTELINLNTEEGNKKASDLYTTYSNDYKNVGSINMSDPYVKSQLQQKVFSDLATWSNSHQTNLTSYQTAVNAADKKYDDLLNLDAETKTLEWKERITEAYRTNNLEEIDRINIEKRDWMLQYGYGSFKTKLGEATFNKLHAKLLADDLELDNKFKTIALKKEEDKHVETIVQSNSWIENHNIEAFFARENRMGITDNKKIGGDYLNYFVNAKDKLLQDTAKDDMNNPVKILNDNKQYKTAFEQLATKLGLNQSDEVYVKQLAAVDKLVIEREKTVAEGVKSMIRSSNSPAEIKKLGKFLVDNKLDTELNVIGDSRARINTLNEQNEKRAEKEAVARWARANWDKVDFNDPSIPSKIKYEIKEKYKEVIKSGNKVLMQQLAKANFSQFQTLFTEELNGLKANIVNSNKDNKLRQQTLAKINELASFNQIIPGSVNTGDVAYIKGVTIIDRHMNDPKVKDATIMKFNEAVSTGELKISRTSDEGKALIKNIKNYTDQEEALQIGGALRAAGLYTKETSQEIAGTYNPIKLTGKKMNNISIPVNLFETLGINGKLPAVKEKYIEKVLTGLDGGKGDVMKSYQNNEVTLQITNDFVYVNNKDGKTLQTVNKKKFFGNVDINKIEQEELAKNIGGTSSELNKKVYDTAKHPFVKGVVKGATDFWEMPNLNKAINAIGTDVKKSWNKTHKNKD